MLSVVRLESELTMGLRANQTLTVAFVIFFRSVSLPCFPFRLSHVVLCVHIYYIMDRYCEITLASRRHCTASASECYTLLRKSPGVQ